MFEKKNNKTFMAALPSLSADLWQNISSHVTNLPPKFPVITCIYFIDHWGMIDGTNKDEMEESNALAIHVSKAVSREEYEILKSAINCPEHGLKKRWINGEEQWIEFPDSDLKPIYPEFRLSFRTDSDISYVCGKFLSKAFAMGWNFATMKDHKSFECGQETFRLSKVCSKINPLMRALPSSPVQIKPVIYFNYKYLEGVAWHRYPNACMQMFCSKAMDHSEFEMIRFKGHRHYDTAEDLQDFPDSSVYEPVEPESDIFYPVYEVKEYSPMEKDIVEEHMAIAFALGWNYASPADYESHMSGLRSFLLIRN